MMRLRQFLPIKFSILQILEMAPATATFAFDAIKGSTYRYMANTILNAGFLQMDNQFTKDLRVVWGLRVENYDQLVGSVKKWDPRHTHTEVTDFLPGCKCNIETE